jgi:uncharacterized protein (TIGR02145 family)
METRNHSKTGRHRKAKRVGKFNITFMKRLTLLLVLIIYSLMTYSQDTGETVTDVDGNVYHTIKIGTQVWMLENLKTTKYRSHAPIQKLIDAGKWEYDASGAYSWYNDDESSKDIYGALYNWAAVNKGNLAPNGWHIPSIEEWQVLIDFLGGEKIAGGKMKDLGTDFWDSPNTGGDNSSGFKAIANGVKSKEGSYSFAGNRCIFWSSTGSNLLQAKTVTLMFNSPKVFIFSNSKNYGCAVRCIKD